MPASEIDDIFSGKVSLHALASRPKAKGNSKASVASSSATQLDTPTTTKKSKKRKSREDDTTQSAPPATYEAVEGGKKAKRKRPVVVETIHDPSIAISTSTSNSNASTMKKSKSKKKARDEDRADEDVEKFTDSRGTGPRRKTEEGFFVYKEDELGIKDEGGDTPLCPFDCNCCF